MRLAARDPHTQGHKTRKDLLIATDFLHLAATAIASVPPNNPMGSNGLAEALEHIASVGSILERVVVAQTTLDSTTELEVVDTPISSSTEVPPPIVLLATASTPRLITERPLGLQRLHD